jgi:rhamnose transport system permease protein
VSIQQRAGEAAATRVLLGEIGHDGAGEGVGGAPKAHAVSRRIHGLPAGLRRSETGLILLIALTSLIAASTLSDFRTSININESLNNAAPVAIVAIGETVVILAREIDLSVGAILGLCAYLVGSAVGHFSGPISPFVGVVMALGLGALLGVGNALLVNRVKMPAIIATLATLSIYSGLQVIVTNGSQLYASQVPAWLADLRSASWAGVGPFIWMALICLIVASFLMRMTTFGRDIYALGSNPEAATYLGIRAQLRNFEAFAFCGALAGLGGLLYTSQYGNVDATAGNGFELTVIAAAVIGGVSLFGGSGTPLSAVLGALLLTEIENILALLRISIFAQQTLEGSAIVIAVAVYAVTSRRLRRPVLRERGIGRQTGATAAPAPVPGVAPTTAVTTRFAAGAGGSSMDGQDGQDNG